jgi:hypothetical protein
MGDESNIAAAVEKLFCVVEMWKKISLSFTLQVRLAAFQP